MMIEVMEGFTPRITDVEQRITDLQFQTDLVREEVNAIEETNNEQGQRLHELGL